MQRDPSDWLGILQDAVENLRNRGVDFVYLILDDHIPVGPCQSHYLNVTFPNLLQSESVGRLALFGGGQFQPQDGMRFRIGSLWYERPSGECEWVFCLHPALWSLHALSNHLSEVRSLSDKELITAWEYEWLAAKGVREGILQGIRHLRVLGSQSAESQNPPKLLPILPFIRVLVRSTVGLLRALGLAATANNIQERAHSFSKYYHGPYPYFWSGLLLRGKIQTDLIKWLRLNGRGQLAKFLLESADKSQ